jgi:hypothetical protein
VISPVPVNVIGSLPSANRPRVVFKQVTNSGQPADGGMAALTTKSPVVVLMVPVASPLLVRMVRFVSCWMTWILPGAVVAVAVLLGQPGP